LGFFGTLRETEKTISGGVYLLFTTFWWSWGVSVACWFGFWYAFGCIIIGGALFLSVLGVCLLLLSAQGWAEGKIRYRLHFYFHHFLLVEGSGCWLILSVVAVRWDRGDGECGGVSVAVRGDCQGKAET
jgi:hypothetical protein